MTVRVAVIGAGLIGSRRAAVAAAHPDSQVVRVVDVNLERAQQVAAQHGAQASTAWQDAVNDPQVDAVVVSTLNKFLSPIAVAALQAGKHTLAEKPPGRNGAEAAAIATASAANPGVVFKAGFTLRFQPALRHAQALCAAGEIGPLMFVRAVYGHGGRPGYDKEWRGNVDLAGGGEMLDQGVHLIDLARWFLGDFSDARAALGRWFWDIAPLEDNAFITLTTAGGQVAQMHTTWTQWKNRFSFEVFGRDGYARVEGLGGSYGEQTLIIGKRPSQGGAPTEETFTFPGPDLSWDSDWADFMGAVANRHPAEVDAEGGAAVLSVVDALYASAGVDYASMLTP